MKRVGYYVYRDGKADFPGLLREALRDFHGRHRQAPEGIVVCRGAAEKARKALAEMGLGLSVQENGGTLWGEIWLLIPEEANDATTDSRAEFPRPAPDAGGDILDPAHSGQWMQPELSIVESVPGGYQEL